MKTIFEKSVKGQRAYSLPRSNDSFEKFFPSERLTRKQQLNLPEVSELGIVRHFTGLSKKSVGIDTTFYPLGSCTMKYNPRACEYVASLPSFIRTHPLAPKGTVDGNLKLIDSLIEYLCKICGMSVGTLAPNAGAQGEFVGLQMIHAYHADDRRTDILVPDDAHGTNPASVTMAGYNAVPVRTNDDGTLDLDHLKELASESTAGLMLTCPNTLGLFNASICEVAKIVHDVGGLLYYDGANLNAIMNICRPGDMGFDVMHVNLHKTFATPHGGGGPGAGPVLCNDRLASFLPNDGRGIGRIASFQGNFGVLIRAYLYIKLLGFYGLRRASENAVVNANYLKTKLSKLLSVPYPQPCMHEFVVHTEHLLDKGIRALDIAKRLLDYNIHAPTMYFPLIVKECMLIEPTETESKETLDHFVAIIEQIVSEVDTDPELVKGAPYNTYRRRLDDVAAARNPILRG